MSKQKKALHNQTQTSKWKFNFSINIKQFENHEEMRSFAISKQAYQNKNKPNWISHYKLQLCRLKSYLPCRRDNKSDFIMEIASSTLRWLLQFRVIFLFAIHKTVCIILWLHDEVLLFLQELYLVALKFQKFTFSQILVFFLFAAQIANSFPFINAHCIYRKWKAPPKKREWTVEHISCKFMDACFGDILEKIKMLNDNPFYTQKHLSFTFFLLGSFWRGEILVFTRSFADVISDGCNKIFSLTF